MRLHCYCSLTASLLRLSAPLLIPTALATQVLEALRDFDLREAELRKRYEPALALLPSLQARLDTREMDQLAEFAVSEGVRGYIILIYYLVPLPLSNVCGTADQSL